MNMVREQLKTLNERIKKVNKRPETDASEQEAALLRNEMDRLARQLPEYPVVSAMGGVGETFAAKLMAEIGDVTRFDRTTSLVHWAGVVEAPPKKPPRTLTWRADDDTNRKKPAPKGQTELKYTLFLIMQSLLKTKPAQDPVYDYMQKQFAKGKPYYICTESGSRKFLNIYYARVKECLLQQEQQETNLP